MIILFFFFFSSVILTYKMSVTETIELKQRHIHREQAIESGHRLIDPLSLQDQKITEDYLKSLKGRKKLQKFYKKQNGLIDTMLKAFDASDSEEEEKQLLKVFRSCPLLDEIFFNIS